MSSEKNKKILDKIRKLLAKAKDPAATESEMEAFMKKAKELMMINDIEESSIEIHVSDINKSVTVSELFKHFKFKYADFEWELMDVIGKAYNCKVYSKKLWDSELRARKKVQLTLIGTEQNRLVAMETYEVLSHKFLNFFYSRYKEYKVKTKADHINKMISMGLKPEKVDLKSLERIGVMSTRSAWAGSYLSGCVAGLRSAYREQQSETLKKIDSQKHGLMVLKMNELIELAVPALIGKTREVNNVGKKGLIDRAAFNEGYADGRSSNTNKLIG
jgi:hypothetical protein